MTSFMGEWDEGSQTNLSASAIVSNYFILKYSMCRDAIFGGVCPEPHHMLVFRRKTNLSIRTIENHFPQSLSFGEALKEEAMKICRKKILEIRLTIKNTVIFVSFCSLC